jgi:hypothetical protein
VEDGEDQRAHDREQGHGLGEAVDRGAPFLLEQQQDGGDQRPRVTDADPPDEVDDVERPADGDVVPPGADASVDRVAEADDQAAQHADGDGEQGPPALASALPDVVEQAVVDGAVVVLPLDERAWV